MANTSSEGVMLSPEQQIVFNWLNDELELPVYAEVYKGALYFLDQKLPGYITFVAHAGRELMNNLARLGSGREQVQYPSRLDELQEMWENEWGAEEINTVNSAEDGHLISSELCEKMQDLIDKHRAGRIRASEAGMLFLTTFLDYTDRDEIPQNLLTEWKDASNWFVAHAHLRDKAFEFDAPSKVERYFCTLDDLLYTAASSEFERIRGINEILEETNE